MSTQDVVTLDAQQWRRFRSRLLHWYQESHRPLPWRETTDPYKIWVSEIMLQQTQVATVLDYYRRFLEAFPTVGALASAQEDAVLAMWSGLGYYRRARQLHAAAQKIVDDLQGEFPRTLEGVLELPGIGRYTAGAITSFAFDLPSPILEANTIRLFSRLLRLREDPRIASSQVALWGFAGDLVKNTKQSPARMNQAVMELGSQVCTPQSPHCDKCPVSQLCPTYNEGLQSEIPLPKPKKTYIEETHVLVVLQRAGEYLLRQNEPGRWWEGLWDFPRTKIRTPLKKSSRVQTPSSSMRRQFSEDLMEDLGLDATLEDWFHSLKHGVTKYKIQLHCYDATLAGELPSRGQWQWAKLDEIGSLPITSSARKVLARLQNA